MDAFVSAILAGGMGLQLGIIVGLMLGLRGQRDLARDAATFRAEMALAEKRTEATMRAKYGLAPKVVRQ